MAIQANAAVGGKPPDLAPKKSKNYRAPHPGSSRVSPPVDDSRARRAVYSGRDLLGSYRRFRDRWLAIDRLGKPLGQYATETEAANAISAAAGRADECPWHPSAFGYSTLIGGSEGGVHASARQLLAHRARIW
jgi:hypothetical protein